MAEITINDLPTIDVSDLQGTDVLYIYRESGSPKDVAMTVDEFKRTALPPVFGIVEWGASDQDLSGSLSAWVKSTGWSSTPLIDTYGMWDSANSRFTVQEGLEGAFIILGTIRIDDHISYNTDRWIVSIRKNNSEKSRGQTHRADFYSPSGGSAYDNMQVMWYDPSAVQGDYYELWMYTQGGGALSHIESSVNTYHQFGICRIAGRDEV